MKFLMLAVMMLSTSSFAESLYNERGEKVEVKCEVNLKYRGIFWTECPPNSIATGTDAQVTNLPFVITRVRCVVPEVTCKTEEIEE